LFVWQRATESSGEVQTCSGVRAVIALTAHAKAQAVILDEQTPCSAAVDAIDSPDKDKMRVVETYIEGVFAKLDQRYRESGEPGILVGLNDREAAC
jgi:hypothetical protein